MNRHVTSLVRTPTPFKFESLKGFILRSSEANGYSSPTMMLSDAGMSNGEMISAIPPLDILAPLFNLKLSELTKLGYRKPTGKPSSKNVWIYNHQLPTFYLNIKSPKICTECISEKGFTESFWDLKYAIACPIHGKLLFRKCPDCNKQISWFRPGLLTCACGSDLSKFSGEPLNNAPVLGLLSFMRNQLLGQPHDAKLLEIGLGFPVDHLSRLTLTELLSLIKRLENRIFHSNSVSTEQHEQILLAKASKALENWPEGFFQYLDSFNNERTSTEGFGLRKQFESFCGSLFKSDIPKDKISFIKKAFVNYGNEKWKRGYVPHFEKNHTKIVGIHQLSKSMGIAPTKTKNLLQQVLVESKTSELNGRTRHFYDISQGLPFNLDSGASFRLRKAAEWLELPVSVLRLLRQQGHFSVRHIANPITSYHEKDLMIFRERLLKLCPSDEVSLDGYYITFAKAMRMKVGSAQFKMNFIKAILNHEISAEGKCKHGVGGLVFSKETVKNFMENQKRNLFGYSSVASASKFLRCDPLVVKRLYQDGLLSGHEKSNGLFIMEESLMKFGERYISCAAVADNRKTTSLKIVNLCDINNIDVTWFPRANNLPPQPFIKRGCGILL